MGKFHRLRRRSCLECGRSRRGVVRRSLTRGCLGRSSRVSWLRHMVSSAFVHWEGFNEDGTHKGRFVQNFHIQSKQWSPTPTRMDTKKGFASLLRKDDHLISFDIKSGYRHFSLHPDVRNYFLFHFNGQFFRCKALPFGWSRSAFWFTNLIKPLVAHLRERFGMRVLPYIDDFLLAPTLGRVSTREDCKRASVEIDVLLRLLGIARHPSKGVWGRDLPDWNTWVSFGTPLTCPFLPLMQRSRRYVAWRWKG